MQCLLDHLDSTQANYCCTVSCIVGGKTFQKLATTSLDIWFQGMSRHYIRYYCLDASQSRDLFLDIHAVVAKPAECNASCGLNRRCLVMFAHRTIEQRKPVKCIDLLHVASIIESQ